MFFFFIESIIYLVDFTGSMNIANNVERVIVVLVYCEICTHVEREGFMKI
jgi:hypothetical protein